MENALIALRDSLIDHIVSEVLSIEIPGFEKEIWIGNLQVKVKVNQNVSK